jgi:L-serine dehydratase
MLENVNEKAQKKDGMESLTQLYKIGRGPSSSHTMGPEKAVRLFSEKNPDADSFRVVLFGSLADTGKGHGTDTVIKKTFYPNPCEIEFNFEQRELPHPNTMELYAYKNGEQIDALRVMSVGGGRIKFEGTPLGEEARIYPLTTFTEIAAYCNEKGIRLWEYAEQIEGEGFYEYMKNIWKHMKAAVERGLADEGILPGGLDVKKKAKLLFRDNMSTRNVIIRDDRLVSAYAYAVSEQNAAGEVIVTAPTCGAAGVMPAVLYHYYRDYGHTDDEIIHALETGGIVGNIIKTNASISGAECGCQAEVGSACAMASAALCELLGYGTDEIEYASEVSIEHHLGLTCDPICGLVQIPCIERNAMAAMRAMNNVSIAECLCDTRKITFDDVVKTMLQTGRDLGRKYRETSEGGLANLKI